MSCMNWYLHFLERNRNKTREKNLEQVYSFYATLNLSGACFLKVRGSFALNISACAHECLVRVCALMFSAFQADALTIGLPNI